MKSVLAQLLGHLIGCSMGFSLVFLIDFLWYKRAIRKRYCKNCLWHFHKNQECLKHAHIENFKFIYPHKSPHCTCDQFKFGKFSLYNILVADRKHKRNENEVKND